jgi:hypothetical protein
VAQVAGITTAIHQLMSRGGPPKSTTPVRQAYTELIAALAGNVPHPIYAGANADELDGRADHLAKVFGALHAYLALTAIRNAAEEMREDENWRAP